MANTKATTKKRSGLIYPAVFILPALIMIACGIIFKVEAIVPYILAYALLAAIPGFFLGSKTYGMAALVTSIIFVTGIGGYTAADNLLSKSGLIEDKAFAGAVSSALGKFPAFITKSDLEEVKVLILEGKYDANYGSPAPGFTLTLGYDEALTYLKAEDQSAYDSEELEGYFKSAGSDVDISDYSSLSHFVNIEYIAVNQPNTYLYYYYGIAPGYLSKFNDLSVLENMKSLSDLIIFNAAASDLSPLAGLVKMENLSVQYCNVGDASVLGNLTALKSLNLSSAGISDISFASSLTNLSELYLAGNQIEDIGAVKNLANLNELMLNSNQIKDVSPVSGLKQLSTLYMSYNQIKDIKALGSLSALESIYLSGNQIEDASPLFSLSSLVYMSVSENALADIGGIESCASLETLYINGNKITDLAPLTGLTGLTSLYADNNGIEDISPVSSVSSLTTLSLKGNQISDISALASLSALTGLYLDENLITDFSPIDALEQGGASVSGKDNQLVEYDHDHDHDHGEDGEYGDEEG